MTSFESLKQKEQLTDKEVLEKVINNEKFLDTVDTFFEDHYEQDKKPQVVLITYNRVGDGSLAGKTEKPNYGLNVLNGAPNMPLAEEKIDEFLEETKIYLERQIPFYKENAPLIVFYGGEGERFNKVGRVIDELNAGFVLYGLKLEQKPKIFLLSCPCQREEKIKVILPMIKEGRLEGLICEENVKEGEEKCGGFDALQNIVGHIEKNYSVDSALLH